MTERDVTIVVAEGPSGRKGLLRFVLESEGYLVVDEAGSSAELARALDVHHPDVVVMDDGIGATAVGMTHDLAPAAKVVLIWPEAVVPIGGDAAVEPSSVLRQLGPTLERLTGAPCASGRMGLHQGTEATGIVSLGAILAMGRAAAVRGATPADLPDPLASDPSEPVIDDRGVTPLLILPDSPEVVPGGGAPVPLVDPEQTPIPGPLTLAELEAAEQRGAGAVPLVGAVAGAATVAGVAAVAGIGAAGAAGAPVAAAVAGGAAPSTALHRRLGTIALGGAALAGSLVLALALSGSRVPNQGVRGEAPGVSFPPPVTASPVVPPPRTVAIPGALLGDLGGLGGLAGLDGANGGLTLVTTNTFPGAGARAGGGGPGTGGNGGGGGGSGPTPTVGTGGGGGGNGSPGAGGGGGGSGGTGGSGTGGGSGGGSGGGGSSGGGGTLGGGGKGGGGKGGGECAPGSEDASPGVSRPGDLCQTDDDELDTQHHDRGHGGDHHGDHGEGHGHDDSGEHEGRGDHHGGDDGSGHDGDPGHGDGGDDG